MLQKNLFKFRVLNELNMKCFYVFSLLLWMSVSVHAANYYISSSGSDASDGRSPATAWQTLAKVNATTFQPGDKILFQAGGIWSGVLAPLGSGIAGEPIIIDKYGKNILPVIHGPGTNNSTVFSLHDQSYWEVNNLEITNMQTSGGAARLNGITVAGPVSGEGVNHIYIRNCYVHNVNSISRESDSNFSKGCGGIIFTGITNDVLIKGCHVRNVMVEGIRNSSEVKCSRFIIDSNLVEDVYGDGIVLHGTKDHSAIIHNVLRNTCYNTSAANYAGAWTYLSDTTLIAYNEVSGITGGGRYDGEAFDADINTNGDIFEYNYSHDNANGFMLFMSDAKNIIVRYNLSVNDVNDKTTNKNDKKIFFFQKSGNSANRQIYNNTFYVSDDIAYLFNTACCGIFSNNIFYCAGSVNQFCSTAVNLSSSFYNNCFYPQAVVSVKGFKKNASGNIYADPKFVNAGFHGNGTANAWRAYALSATSPCRKAGKTIPGIYKYDFAGNNIANRNYTAIGAIWPATQLHDKVKNGKML